MFHYEGKIIIWRVRFALMMDPTEFKPSSMKFLLRFCKFASTLQTLKCFHLIGF